MKCSVCRQELEELNHQCKTHLLLTKSAKDGGIHIHGDIEARENVSELIQAAAEEIGIVIKGAEAKTMPKEVVLHNRQRIGDMLVFTCAVRDFKRAFPDIRLNVVATAMHLFDYNPHLDPTLKATSDNTVKVGPKTGTNQSNSKDWHFTNAYRISIEEHFKVHIPQGESRPDIYFTQEEYDAPRVFDFPYWIISTVGEKGWGCKMYPHAYWQEFVDQNPNIHFVQIGTAEDNAPRLHGANVVDYIGKTQSRETGVRDLLKLFLNAEGSIGLVSFHMHLSGALQKPCIVVAGAREPVHFTRYPGQAYLATDGMLPCAVKACWHCALPTCTNLVTVDHEPVELSTKDRQEGDTPESKARFQALNDRLHAENVRPKCVDMIKPYDLTNALLNYYVGGRLKPGQVSAKPETTKKRGPINVVPTPPKVEKPVTVDIQLQPVLIGEGCPNLPFNGGALTMLDWAFIKGVIKQFNIKGCLEFGAGLSTVLFNQVMECVKTYETIPGWITKVKAECPGADIRLWDGKEVPGLCHDGMPETWGLGFVDGPAGGINREIPTQIAAALCSVVIVHDAGREWEKKWQEKYLVGKFDGPFKGGHRCHLWVKKGLVSRETVPVVDSHDSEPAKGILTQANGISKEVLDGQEAQEEKACLLTPADRGEGKFIKIVSTARGWGGAARSVTTIMKKLLAAGHYVEFIPFRNEITSKEWQVILKGDLKDVKVSLDYETIQESCDVLLMYADDYVWEFNKPWMQETFSRIGADRKIMMLNYRRGDTGKVAWTKGWDKYMFLCSWQEQDLLKILPGVRTKVLPPCTELEPFFNVQPDYEGLLRIVRHSSQGDTKFSPDFNVEVVNVLENRPDAELHFLPGPSFVAPRERVFKYPRTDKPEVIADFLAKGNLFWYSVPVGYQDMGPRVIVEAMAAGLPVVADASSGGAADRVINGVTGVLCYSKADHIQAIREATPKYLKRCGEAARARAHDHFSPDAWIHEILKDSVVTI